MAATGKGTFQPFSSYFMKRTSFFVLRAGCNCFEVPNNFKDSDVHISYEDQQKINKFARLNAKVDDFKDELKVKQNDIKNLEDAVEELSLTDDSEKIPYLIGEVFICQSLEDTLKSLDEAKTKKEDEMSELLGKIDELKSQMSTLKAHLYGKFGSHINLENEEE